MLHLRPRVRQGQHHHSHSPVREEVGRGTAEAAEEAEETGANKTFRYFKMFDSHIQSILYLHLKPLSDYTKFAEIS